MLQNMPAEAPLVVHLYVLPAVQYISRGGVGWCISIADIAVTVGCTECHDGKHSDAGTRCISSAALQRLVW